MQEDSNVNFDTNVTHDMLNMFNFIQNLLITSGSGLQVLLGRYIYTLEL